MSELLVDLIPVNLLEEKAKFFQDFSYNPQLKYNRTFSYRELHLWGNPIQELTEHSRKMLKLHTAVASETDYVDETFILQEIEKFNTGYNLKEPMIAEFSEKQVTRCRVNGNHIYFQLPIRYTESKLGDLFRHELETHVLRTLNEKEQKWGDQHVDGVSFRKTEEGLAGLHTFLFREDKVVRKSYLTYLAVSIAQMGSFTDVFSALRAEHVSEEVSWSIALRTKRGMEDTSEPGGLTKDISYLEGSVQVWKWLMNPKNHPEDLYIGRVGLADIPRLLPIAKKDNLLYPHFLSDHDQYLSLMEKIGKVNNFDQLTNLYD